MARALKLTPAHRWVLAAAALAALTLALHGSVLDMGWRHDDPAHLRFVGAYAPWQYFGLPAVMREQSYAHITPWNALFYEIGLKLFGLDARGHYAHMLAVIWATALVTWALLRERTGECAAMAGAALFLVMPPTGAMAQLLMTGHYAYGLLATALAIWCWSTAAVRRRMPCAWAAAFFYALACLCKELYVPLPAVLLFFPALPLRVRLRLLAPILLVAVLYAGFRLWLLGGPGGYAKLVDVTVADQGAIWSALQRVFAGVVHMALGAGTGGWLALALVLACLAVGLWQGWRARPVLVAAALVALVVPVAPVLLTLGQGGIAGRFLVMIGWALSVSLAASTAHAGPRSAWLALALALTLGWNQRLQAADVKEASRPGQFENQFILDGPASAHLVPWEYGQTGYLHSLRDARQLIRGDVAPTLVEDEEQLAHLGETAGRRAWSWAPDCKCLRQLGGQWDARARAFLQGTRAGDALVAGMSVKVDLRDEGRLKRLVWRVQGPAGPLFFEMPRFGRFEAAREASVPFGVDTTVRLERSLHIRAVIETANGEWVRSPLLVLPTTGSNSVSWHGTD